MNTRLPTLYCALALLVSCVGPATPKSYDYRPSSFESPSSPLPKDPQQSSYSAPASPPSQSAYSPAGSPPALDWEVGRALMQGFFGVSYFEHVAIDGGSGVEVDGDDGELDQLPLLGGGAQWKLGGERMDMGLEGIFAMSGRADATAFVVSGGGGAIAVDVDLLILEIYGGPFVNFNLGEKMRVYGALGPVLQFADYDQSGNGLSDDGSGFGSGLYARTGIEFMLPSRTYIGLGVRWSDTTVDLGGDLGDLEVDGLQAVLTVSRSY